MNQDFATIIRESPLILTECAISERLRRDAQIELHPTLFNTPLIYQPQGREKMAQIYRQYRSIAARAEVPVLLCAPTWRVDQMRLRAAGYDETLLSDAVGFIGKLAKEIDDAHSPVVVGGLLGPKNDCYAPDQALSAAAAADYHRWQIDRLARAEVDCLIAQTIPALSEALGIAQAMADAAVCGLISFVIDRHGKVLDGTPLDQAIDRIDNQVDQPPLGYMVNCVYPTFVCPENQPRQLFSRLVGIQANSSSLDHHQLDGAAVLHRDDLVHWGEHMLRLNRTYGVKILGGCCGTDDSYLQYLVDHRSSAPR